MKGLSLPSGAEESGASFGAMPFAKHPFPPARLENGQAWPLGAHWDGTGVNFAVVSAHASRIELCVFDASGLHEIARLPLPAHSNDVWHGYLRGAGPGLIYGLRAHGPWRPEHGHRFNPAKLLLDPYAREIVGHFEWRDEHFAHDRGHWLHPDHRDNAGMALKARVIQDKEFDWEDDHPLHLPADATVLYEIHVKSFSRLNPALPEALRGTYAGLAHEASLSHFKHLGITTLSILPVHQALDEERLVNMGLSNYWGYNTLSWFCADPRLASQPQGKALRDEFRNMVKTLHRAGIEVLLDVVFNHSAESDELGPCLSLRGLDNALYYRLPPEDRTRYENLSGCGNTLDIRQPRVLQLVLDSLRYWVSDMHVDGFRFDLAPVMGRDGDHFSKDASFFTALAQDPVLSRVKLIAEPWDLGRGGYQLGHFPRGWHEWNDQFRDTMRRFWLHADSTRHTNSPVRGEFAMRLCGSSDLYQRERRTPADSVNYVVSHDGFTLRDLVSYRQRHNHANGEDNRDGHSNNLSENCGAEGPSTRDEVNALRARLQRALLATTLLSQGTPMLCAGDELGHSQGGNNNPYCQDNETTWIDWSKADQDLLGFVRHVLALRREYLPLAPQWYSGLPDARGVPDLSWALPGGQALQDTAWQDPDHKAITCIIGKPGRGEAMLALLINPHREPQDFALPPGQWEVLLDSSTARGRPESAGACLASGHWQAPDHALCLLKQAPPPGTSS